jgi:hypothetical protein
VKPARCLVNIRENLQHDIAVSGESFPKLIDRVMAVAVDERNSPIGQQTANVISHPKHFIGVHTFLKILFYQHLAAFDIKALFSDLIPITGRDDRCQTLTADEHVQVIATIFHFYCVELLSVHFNKAHRAKTRNAIWV